MAKLYNHRSELSGETLHARVLLQDWVREALQTNAKSNSVFELLSRSGRYFTKILDIPPVGIVQPNKIREHKCHSNNIVYAEILADKQPEVLDDFAFVSGFYGMKATHACVPLDQKYFISSHSFMTYKGSVLDYTMLRCPPPVYKPDQYFGIAFDIRVVLRAYEELFKRDNNIVPQFSVLEVLQNEPYLKE